ncbi:zinc-binding dehydrogenase [Baekduia soli]|uniref:Zinc-binding dehydrogenase n=1 Tax=Baekduia soli TaxID=496014 RepID=A0A5B8U9I8_9ACTN|nr:zinc-binding dehydrogenase [Baekduia soli]QEC49734.1 zinc-binding dehydrogenase [Baekduia soli]
MAQQTGRAAVLTEYNADFTLQEFEVPEPEPGAIVVEIDTATVCGSDVHVWEGALEGVIPVHLPLILGHEMVGRVAKLGDGAAFDSVGEPLREGDRVIWTHEPCLRCYSCTIMGETTLCTNRRLGFLEDCSKPPHFTGGFADYGYVWARSGRIRVPDDVQSDWASAGSCALRTVIKAIEKAMPVDYLDSVVVQGSGPLGLFATAMLSTHSPRHLIVVGAPDDRLELAREWGATHTISVQEYPDAPARLDEVLRITGSRGPSVVLEVAGARGAAGEGVQMMAPKGRYVVVGTITGEPQPINVPRVTTRAVQVLGSMGGDTDAYWKAMRFLSAFRDRFDWDRMLGRRYPLEHLSAAMRSSKEMRDVKAVIDPAMAA